MPTLSFATYDVFTDQRFAGNPLAVVYGADALNDAAMQTIAKEFNLAETIFVQTPQNAAHSAKVRIFTPAQELPFAGHPTIGCAVALAEQRGAAGDFIITLEEQVGLVRCAVKVTNGAASFAEFDAPRLAEEAGSAATVAVLAAALGLDARDIGFDKHVPTIYSAGVSFAFAPLNSLGALARAKPSASLSEDAIGAHAIYCYARLPEDSPHAFRARMFGFGLGIVEDPATGGAAAAFAGVAARFEPLMAGWHTLPIEQGIEMGRPSLIGLEIEVNEGKLTAARIAGRAVRVSKGELEI